MTPVLLGLTQAQGLVIVFIVLPIVVAAIFVPIMVRVLSRGPRPVLTSELLATGTPAEGRVLRIRTLGTVLDVRPMVRFDLEIRVGPEEPPFELQVVQAVPRTMLGTWQPGDVVRVRLAPDRTAGAVEWGYEPGGPGPA